MSSPTPGQGRDGIDVKQITLTTSKTIGNGDKINGLIGVYMKTGVSGDLVPFKIRGEVYATARSTQSWAVGTVLYYQATGTRFTSSSTGNTKAGVAGSTKASGTANGWVMLGGPASA